MAAQVVNLASSLKFLYAEGCASAAVLLNGQYKHSFFASQGQVTLLNPYTLSFFTLEGFFALEGF